MSHLSVLIVAAVCLLILNGASSSPVDSTDQQWKLFQENFDKIYANEAEEELRKQIFMETVKDIEEHNKLFEQKEVSYKKAVNQFSDMRYEEFIKQMGGLNVNLKRKTNKLTRQPYTFVNNLHNDTDEDTIPESMDWRSEGAVTSVKDQGFCGSCWAFSATGAMEGQHFRKTGRLIRLSEQNLVDCSGEFGNEGCNGGWMDWAFEYVKENEGIAKELFYPYEGNDNICRYFSFFKGTSVSSYVDLPEGDEDALKRAVATVGPIAIAYNVQDSFQEYQEGVYYQEDCASDVESMNHGMLAVGYGTTDEGEDYWLLKNSWGRSWGEAGYIKVARNKDNACGIATVASYPEV